MPAFQDSKTCTIADGQTVSDAIYVGDKQPVQVQLPALLTSTAMKFQGSSDGSTYVAIHTPTAEYSVTVASSKIVSIDPAYFAGVRWIKCVGGSAESGAKIITVLLKKRSI